MLDKILLFNSKQLFKGIKNKIEHTIREYAETAKYVISSALITTFFINYIW